MPSAHVKTRKMAKFNCNLLELNVEELFREHKIEDIIEIDKLYDAEIEKKRVELRSTVGDRYKDILAASDAIKNMKTISENIVINIDGIQDSCSKLIQSTSVPQKTASKVNESKLDDRATAAQIRLLTIANEHIWIASDDDNYSLAAQLYLFVQHVYTGLFFGRSNHSKRFPIIKRIEDVSKVLKERALKDVRIRLESVELGAEETSGNLIALLLLENHTSSELLSTFIEHRKAALRTVTKESYSSVRAQVCAMVKCLINTVHLLHSCFIEYGKSERSLIEQELDEIIGENAPVTLTKINLPSSPLLQYIPDIVEQFRPKLNSSFTALNENDLKRTQDWLQVTKGVVAEELSNSLNLVTTAKGLHIIREDAHKIALPENWKNMCVRIGLPEDFDIWQYYFQLLVTNRAEALISKKVASIVEDVCSDIAANLNDLNKIKQIEKDLLRTTWIEEPSDVSRSADDHLGLSMKTKGFSPIIIELCNKLDSKYLGLLEDVSFYFHGTEYDGAKDLHHLQFSVSDAVAIKKFADRKQLEKHLQTECSLYTKRLVDFLKNAVGNQPAEESVIRALICARFCHALVHYCSSFRKCCGGEEWDKICNLFSSCGLEFWNMWIEHCLDHLDKRCDELLHDIDVNTMLGLLPKWDVIEIQEQTEEKIFKSQIKIPSHPSSIMREMVTTVMGLLNGVLPHTLPKQVQRQFVAGCARKVLEKYGAAVDADLNQTQALQFLFDVKFLTTFCVARENGQLTAASQEICDTLRSKVDPFDLDVFYSHLQNNVKRYVVQSQAIFGCLLPSSGQLASLGISEKVKEQHKNDPSILAVSTPASTAWFQLLPITVPVQKTTATSALKDPKVVPVKQQIKATPKRGPDSAPATKSGAAALFGGLTTDWFS